MALQSGPLVYAAIGAAGLLFLLVMLVSGDVFGGDGHVNPSIKTPIRAVLDFSRRA